jgi:hypothetical protein
MSRAGQRSRQIGGSMYMLERAELYIVPEPLTKNRTCQTTRWKQVAMCEEKGPLIEMKRINKTLAYKLRVVDYSTLEVIE